jgi:secondary thiamine-phosphate synthase enzyme
MKIYKEKIILKSSTQIEFLDITEQTQEIIGNSGIREGQVLVYAPHTTMSIVINHNESMLMQDFMRVLYKLAPVDEQYSHDLFELKNNTRSDGRSNGHSHCKAMIIGNQTTVPIEKGKMMLTKIQSIFAVEFDGGRERDLIIQVIGN